MRAIGFLPAIWRGATPIDGVHSPASEATTSQAVHGAEHRTPGADAASGLGATRGRLNRGFQGLLMSLVAGGSVLPFGDNQCVLERLANRVGELDRTSSV